MTFYAQCTCYLLLKARDGSAQFERHVILPFVPFIDLELNFSGDEDDCNEFKVEHIEYYVPTGKFLLYASVNIGDDQCPCTFGDDCCVLENEHIGIDAKIENGWKLLNGEVDRLCNIVSNPPVLYRESWQFSAEQMELLDDQGKPIREVIFE